MAEFCSLSVQCSENAPECLSGNRDNKTLHFWPLDVGFTPVVQKRCRTLQETFCTTLVGHSRHLDHPEGSKTPEDPRSFHYWNVILVHAHVRLGQAEQSPKLHWEHLWPGLRAQLQYQQQMHFLDLVVIAPKMIGSVWVYSRESPLNYQRALNPAPRSDRTPLIPKWTCFVQSKATKHCMIQLFWQFFSPHTLNLGKTSESFGHFVGEVTNQVSESWVTASPASPSLSGNLSWRFPRSLRSLWFSAPSDSDNLSNCLLQHLGTFHIWPWSWKRVRLSSSKT